MRILFFVSMILFLYSCDEGKSKPEYPDKETTEIFKGVDYEVVKIDSCEYIIGKDHGSYNGGFFLTHKGNCKNPIHY